MTISNLGALGASFSTPRTPDASTNPTTHLSTGYAGDHQLRLNIGNPLAGDSHTAPAASKRQNHIGCTI